MRNLRTFHALTAVLCVLGLLSGCAVVRKYEAGGSPDDAKITSNVQALINQLPDVGPPDSVKVQTRDHVVYLSGLVSTGLVKRTAEDFAQKTAGVNLVVNDIAVTESP
jgi:osmotically-inducible protein OsmY